LLVYIDESGFATDMPRTHGYAPTGKPCIGRQDWNAKGRINVIGALLGGLLLTASLFDCSINSEVFHSWVEQDLLPKLPAKSVIVMDNATFHKRQDTQQVIEDAGHTLEFLPPYSPDLNPIEKKWAQVKQKRRKTGQTTRQIFKNEI
jgi:transposase